MRATYNYFYLKLSLCSELWAEKITRCYFLETPLSEVTKSQFSNNSVSETKLHYKILVSLIQDVESQEIFHLIGSATQFTTVAPKPIRNDVSTCSAFFFNIPEQLIQTWIIYLSRTCKNTAILLRCNILIKANRFLESIFPSH